VPNEKFISSGMDKSLAETIRGNNGPLVGLTPVTKPFGNFPACVARTLLSAAFDRDLRGQECPRHTNKTMLL
jgi:hypothetical protein